MTPSIESYLKTCAGMDVNRYHEALKKGDELAVALDGVQNYAGLDELHENDERYLLLIEIKKKWNPNYITPTVK